MRTELREDARAGGRDGARGCRRDRAGRRSLGAELVPYGAYEAEGSEKIGAQRGPTAARDRPS